MFRELQSLIKLKYSIALASLLAIVSCTEFQEPNLEVQEIEILLPRDSLESGYFNQHFYWYPLDDANGYEVQIAEPNFSEILSLTLDTVLEATEFRYTLRPGEYEWRIRAYNSSSYTSYQSRTLIIDSTLNLNAQQILLSSPQENDTFNDLNPVLKWQNIYGSEEYELEVFEEAITGLVLHDLLLDSSSFKLDLKSEGAYFWRVRAMNPSSSTPFSSRSFYIDTAKPLPPQTLSPQNQAIYTQGDTVTFKWLRTADNGSSKVIELIWSRDSTFQDYSAIIQSSTDSLFVDSISFGRIFWKIRSIDAAGNIGSFGVAKEFTIQ